MIKTLTCHKAEPTVLSNQAMNSDNTTMNQAQFPPSFAEAVRAWLLVLLDGDSRSQPRSPNSLYVYLY